jgi:hypothetical protein
VVNEGVNASILQTEAETMQQAEAEMTLCVSCNAHTLHTTLRQQVVVQHLMNRISLHHLLVHHLQVVTTFLGAWIQGAADMAMTSYVCLVTGLNQQQHAWTTYILCVWKQFLVVPVSVCLTCCPYMSIDGHQGCCTIDTMRAGNLKYEAPDGITLLAPA